MPRGARLDAQGPLHHVILRGIERKKIVKDDADRKNFVTRMGDIAAETDIAIYAWALLDNHAHILLRSGPLGLPAYMRRLLTGYAISFNLQNWGHSLIRALSPPNSFFKVFRNTSGIHSKTTDILPMSFSGSEAGRGRELGECHAERGQTGCTGNASPCYLKGHRA